MTPDRPLAGVRVGLDLDGVCCDYVAYLRAFLVRSGRVEPLPEPMTYRLEEWFGSEEERIAAHRAAVADGLHRSAPPVPGAVAGVGALRALGAEAVAVSARGSYAEDRSQVLFDIKVWTQTYGIAFDDVHLGRPKAAARCDVYVDDSPVDVAGLRAAGELTVVFGQPWNTSLPGPRAAGWSGLPSLLVAVLRS